MFPSTALMKALSYTTPVRLVCPSVQKSPGGAVALSTTASSLFRSNFQPCRENHGLTWRPECQAARARKAIPKAEMQAKVTPGSIVQKLTRGDLQCFKHAQLENTHKPRCCWAETWPTSKEGGSTDICLECLSMVATGPCCASASSCNRIGL